MLADRNRSKQTKLEAFLSVVLTKSNLLPCANPLTPPTLVSLCTHESLSYLSCGSAARFCRSNCRPCCMQRLKQFPENVRTAAAFYYNLRQYFCCVFWQQKSFSLHTKLWEASCCPGDGDSAIRTKQWRKTERRVWTSRASSEKFGSLIRVKELSREE